MTEADLRTLLDNLDACRASLHGWLQFWTWLVVAGVALEFVSLLKEYRNELHDFKRGIVHPPDKPSLSFFLFGFFGIALVVAGVSGELIIEAKLGTLETKIQKTDNELYSLLSTEARDAATSAKTAHDEADALSREVDAAEKKVGAVTTQAERIGNELGMTQFLVSARYVADPDSLTKELKEFKGKTAVFTSYIDDSEGWGLCTQLAYIAHNAEWKPIDACGKSPPTVPPEIPVIPMSVFGPDTKEAIKLGGIISRIGKQGVSSGGGGQILTIFVGHKSPFTIGPTWQTRAAEELAKKQHANKKKAKP
jgi:hypothetical protein